jgi:hypothetical protein
MCQRKSIKGLHLWIPGAKYMFLLYMNLTVSHRLNQFNWKVPAIWLAPTAGCHWILIKEFLSNAFLGRTNSVRL